MTFASAPQGREVFAANPGRGFLPRHVAARHGEDGGCEMASRPKWIEADALNLPFPRRAFRSGDFRIRIPKSR